MATRLLIWCAAVMFAFTADAGIIYSPSNPINATITDNSAVGWSGTATASGYAASISAITVNLNISGGYNGDLYAYLSYGGVLVPLLNRVGVTGTGGGDPFGYGDTGFSITLSSAGANNVHFYGNNSPGFNGSGQLTGTWQPDGRLIDPLSSPGDFDSATPVTFASFNGLNPNGTWTLFLADMSAGEQSQLVSWSLGITAVPVPEPVNVALGTFAGVFVVVTLVRNQRVRKLFHQVLAR